MIEIKKNNIGTFLIYQFDASNVNFGTLNSNPVTIFSLPVSIIMVPFQIIIDYVAINGTVTTGVGIGFNTTISNWGAAGCLCGLQSGITAAQSGIIATTYNPLTTSTQNLFQGDNLILWTPGDDPNISFSKFVITIYYTLLPE